MAKHSSVNGFQASCFPTPDSEANRFPVLGDHPKPANGDHLKSGQREDVLFLGPGGTGKSRLAQAIGHCAIQQGYKVLYRETHVLLDELADAIADGTRKEYMDSIATAPLLIIDDFGMRKLPHTAAEIC